MNPDRQTGAQYLGNQLKKIPGEVTRGVGNAVTAPLRAIDKLTNKKQQPSPTANSDQYHRDQFKKSLSPRDRHTMRPGSRGYRHAYNKYLKTASTPVKPESFSAFDTVLQNKNVDHLID